MTQDNPVAEEHATRKHEKWEKKHFTTSVNGLPMTRVASWQTYADMLTAAESYGGIVARAEVEAWLGRNDLFYLLVRLLNRPDADNDWLFDRCREVEREPDGYLDLWSRGHYKDLADDTPVLTDNRGWTTQGDLQVGDYVYAPSGKPVKVLAVSQQYTDSKCYSITFSDGHKITAGAGHLWRLRKKIKKRISGTDRRRPEFVDELFTTEQLANNPMHRMDVGVAEPLQFTECNVHLIDAYVLGIWLGDGARGCGRVTSADAEVWEEIERRGYSIAPAVDGAITRTVYGIHDILRAYGVLDDKHIPRQFLFASMQTRLDLMRGLMDSDGHCQHNGTATFTNINTQLVDDVYELAQSLGMRPRKRKHVQMLHGEEYDYWQVSWQATTDRNPFLLRRKAERVKQVSKYRDCRYITDIISIDSVPTHCIQVDGGMYCVGVAHIPTHNSTIITFALTVQDILRDPNVTIGIFSHTKKIARAFLNQIKYEFESNDYLKAVYSDILWKEPAKEAPRWSSEEGIIVRRTSNPKESTVEAWGLVDGQPTSKHYAIRVYDDVVTLESVSTKDQIQKTTDAWEISLNLCTTAGRERYIGTRYALFDTYHTMIERDAVKLRVYPATSNGRVDGVPVFLTQEQWKDKLKKNSMKNVAAQLLQNPQADEAAMFSADWLRTYDVRPRTLNVYIMCDPSRGRNVDSDNTAMAVIGISPAGTKFLLDGFCHRMTLSERWRNLFHLYNKWRRAIGVQHVAVGYERYGAQSDDEYFEEQMRNTKVFFEIKELNWTRDGTQSKRERVERLEPDFRNGKLFLPLPMLVNGVPSTWHIDTDRDSKSYGTMTTQPVTGLTSAQRRVVEGGSKDLIAKCIRGVDADGRPYDVTKHLIEEYLHFPFGRYKDFLDAMSRVYDMTPRAPLVMPTGTLDQPAFRDS